MEKVYIYRITNHNGRKDYKRTKCSDYWANNKRICWQFTKQGAKKIVETLTSYQQFGYYSYGIEPINAGDQETSTGGEQAGKQQQK